jgi:UDP-2,3-diacylglucosamine pyrophosphatase LpxH
VLYLVGDIVDGRALARERYWPDSHAAVVRAIHAMARAGTRVVYLRGNHDRDLPAAEDEELLCVERGSEAEHVTADDKRYVVVHGDEFARAQRVDGVICGHVRHPASRELAGVAYHNDGDWVESCTALVERLDGRLELVRAA